MSNSVEDTAKVNAEFVTCVTRRAAEILRKAQKDHEEIPPVIEALRQARDEFQEKESRKQKGLRTYHWANLVNDLRWYLINHECADAETFTPIGQWKRTHDPATMADTLTEAAPIISRTVEKRTITTNRLRTMNEKELGEYLLMKTTAEFLKEQGLKVEINWEREDPSAPLDYRGTVNGASWAFELTKMREDPEEGYHRKAGHPKERKSIEDQMKQLEEPLPQIPDGPEELQRNLDRAVGHGRKESKTRELDGSKYCLVIHNRQFLYVPDWQKITWPDLEDFDAVMILHDEMIPPARVWQVIPPDAFGRTVDSGKVDDLHELVLAQQGQGPNPTVVKKAWQHLDELDITEDDITDAVKEARETG